jgi:hypothetical protein
MSCRLNLCVLYRLSRIWAGIKVINRSLTHLRTIMATLNEVKDLAAKVSADIDTKLAAKDAQIADIQTKLTACEAADVALKAQLDAALANAADPAVVQSIADTLTAADAKLV